jgi:Zn-dependent protease with chaperone function
VLSPATITVDYEREKKEENTAIILLIAGFFFPIFWLICFIITRKNISEKSKRYGFIAIGLFITSVFIIIITFVAAVVASAVSRAV